MGLLGCVSPLAGAAGHDRGCSWGMSWQWELQDPWKCVAHSPRSLWGGEGLKGCEAVKGTEVMGFSS